MSSFSLFLMSLFSSFCASFYASEFGSTDFNESGSTSLHILIVWACYEYEIVDKKYAIVVIRYGISISAKVPSATKVEDSAAVTSGKDAKDSKKKEKKFVNIFTESEGKPLKKKKSKGKY